MMHTSQKLATLNLCQKTMRVPYDSFELDPSTGDIYGPNNVVITNLGEEEAAAEYEIEEDPEDRKRKKPLPPNAISLGNN